MRFRRGDRGFTLVELAVTISIIGVLAAVLTGGIAVVFRTQGGIGDIITEAHDLQQAVNYIPGDIQSSPHVPTAYTTSDDGTSGSGCSAAGAENVLRIERADDVLAYRLTDTGVGVSTLDRYRCAPDGTTIEILNIADRLINDRAAPPARARVVLKAVPAGPLEVDRVTLELNQSRGMSVVSGSPRAEDELPQASIASDCTSDPMAETLGFSTFVHGDVRFTNGPQIKWASGIGGSLSFDEDTSIGQNLNDDADLPTIEPFGTALYVHSVDWGASDGKLTIHANRDVVIDDRSQTTIAANGKSAYELGGSTSNPKIVANGSSQVLPVTETIDFDQRFDSLRSCSVALASLLPASGTPSCTSCAVHLEILDQNGNDLIGPYQPRDNMKLRLVEGKANVLNIRAADFVTMGNMSFVNGQKPDENTPLIINIIDEGDVTLSSFPQQGGIGDWVKSTIWNFPNATTVTLQSGNDGVWGTIFAPLAHVESSVKIEGGVVAESWTHDKEEVNGPRVFTGLIDWAG